jgi:circadian clock protein KaiB
MRLALYVAARSPNSLRAIENLRALLAAVPVAPRLDIIDVFTCVEDTLAAGIVVTPTLVRIAPGPTLKIVGDLSDRLAVMTALGLTSKQVSP